MNVALFKIDATCKKYYETIVSKCNIRQLKNTQQFLRPN
jgi:hypothetical protein